MNKREETMKALLRKCNNKQVQMMLINKKMLSVMQNHPYLIKLDMIIAFYYRKNDFNREIIPVSYDMLKEWDVTTDELYKLALYNMEQNTPVSFGRLSQLLIDLAIDLDEDENEEFEIDLKPILEQDREPYMYVLSNRERFLGASTILMPSVLNKLSEILNSDFYMLPSSVHEWIILPTWGSISESDLHDMVLSVNSKCVLPAEQLSDSVYRYDSSTHQVIICKW
ncbi:MAG: DUF5688 family protein [Eubacterium sp.]